MIFSFLAADVAVEAASAWRCFPPHVGKHPSQNRMDEVPKWIDPTPKQRFKPLIVYTRGIGFINYVIMYPFIFTVSMLSNKCSSDEKICLSKLDPKKTRSSAIWTRSKFSKSGCFRFSETFATRAAPWWKLVISRLSPSQNIAIQIIRKSVTLWYCYTTGIHKVAIHKVAIQGAIHRVFARHSPWTSVASDPATSFALVFAGWKLRRSSNSVDLSVRMMCFRWHLFDGFHVDEPKDLWAITSTITLLAGKTTYQPKQVVGHLCVYLTRTSALGISVCTTKYKNTKNWPGSICKAKFLKKALIIIPDIFRIIEGCKMPSIPLAIIYQQGFRSHCSVGHSSSSTSLPTSRATTRPEHSPAS